MKCVLIAFSILTIAQIQRAQGYELPGYSKIVRCTEVFPEPDLRPYRFNVSIFKMLGGTQLIAVVHRVNNLNNNGKNYKQDYVLSQVTEKSPKTITYWNIAETIILDDVRPYQSNKSILFIKGEPGSRWMKCFDIGVD